MPTGSGPAKLSENTKIQRRAPALTDDFFFAAPGTGTGGVSVISALLSLLGSAGPVQYYPTTVDQLANIDIQPNYFAYVDDANDDPAVAEHTWALYLYRGGDRSNLASYVLVAKGVEVASDLDSVLTIGNDAGARQIKNIADGSDPQDVISLAQLSAAIAAIVQHFRGTFISVGALTSAIPVGNAGDYAYVDSGVGSAVQIYIWDVDDALWRLGSSTATPPWSNSTAGVVEESTQAEAEAVITAANAGSPAGTAQARTPSEVGLYYYILKFLTLAWTWTLKQTFTAAPRFSSTTASQVLEVDASKDLISAAKGTAYNKDFATDAETITGTITNKPTQPANITAFIVDWLTKAHTWTLAQTFTIGPTVSDATASLMAAFDASKKLISIAYAAASDIITGTDTTKPLTSSALRGARSFGNAAAVSAGTMTLNQNSAEEMDWEAATAISANFAITQTNKTNLRHARVAIQITTTVAITFDSDFAMVTSDFRWNDSTHVLTLTPGATRNVELSWAKYGSDWLLKCSDYYPV